MNEVEKMYKTIFGKFAPNCCLCTMLIDCEIFNNTHNCNKFECDYKRLFTAEKQLELIKLLSYYYNITISKNFENDYTLQCEGDDVRRYVFTSGQDFAEQIASFVNMCYELLPEEERKQIKNILE